MWTLHTRSLNPEPYFSSRKGILFYWLYGISFLSTGQILGPFKKNPSHTISPWVIGPVLSCSSGRKLLWWQMESPCVHAAVTPLPSLRLSATTGAHISSNFVSFLFADCQPLSNSRDLHGLSLGLLSLNFCRPNPSNHQKSQFRGPTARGLEATGE